jgi:hypothetical protein
MAKAWSFDLLLIESAPPWVSGGRFSGKRHFLARQICGLGNARFMHRCALACGLAIRRPHQLRRERYGHTPMETDRGLRMRRTGFAGGIRSLDGGGHAHLAAKGVHRRSAD